MGRFHAGADYYVRCGSVGRADYATMELESCSVIRAGFDDLSSPLIAISFAH